MNAKGNAEWIQSFSIMARLQTPENVHETPDFTPISGVFYVFSAMVIVYNKNKMKPGDKTGLLHCSPAMNRGFRNNVGAKILILFQNLSQCGKNVA